MAYCRLWAFVQQFWRQQTKTISSFTVYQYIENISFFSVHHLEYVWNKFHFFRFFSFTSKRCFVNVPSMNVNQWNLSDQQHFWRRQSRGEQTKLQSVYESDRRKNIFRLTLESDLNIFIFMLFRFCYFKLVINIAV